MLMPLRRTLVAATLLAGMLCGCARRTPESTKAECLRESGPWRALTVLRFLPRSGGAVPGIGPGCISPGTQPDPERWMILPRYEPV